MPVKNFEVGKLYQVWWETTADENIHDLLLAYVPLGKKKRNERIADYGDHIKIPHGSVVMFLGALKRSFDMLVLFENRVLVIWWDNETNRNESFRELNNDC